jgi:hypothetical protein
MMLKKLTGWSLTHTDVRCPSLTSSDTIVPQEFSVYSSGACSVMCVVVGRLLPKADSVTPR